MEYLILRTRGEPETLREDGGEGLVSADAVADSSDILNEPRRVCEQLVHCDTGLISRGLGKEIPEGVLDPEPSLFHQLDDGRSCELLGHGCEVEQRLVGDAGPRSLIGQSVPRR